MREIKFRAWDKKCIEVYGTGMSYGEHEYFDDMLAFRFNHFESDNPSEIIYEQFTGLRDKNGKEIYEGDIVRWDINQSHPIGIVDYIDSYGGYDLKNIYDDYHVCNDWGRGEYEVVGNIHENPELLK